MTTTVLELLQQLAPLVQEDQSTYGGTDWSTGLWTPEEIIGYINFISRDFVLRSQIIKILAAVASVTGQRIYSDPPYTMGIDRIAFNNNPLYKTSRYLLDRENINWRTLAGVPRQYHQDQLATKTFEVDRAPTSAMTGAGYTAVGRLGVLRFAFTNSKQITDAGMTVSLTFLNSVSANFTLADVGKYVAVAGAGPDGDPLVTTITARNSATQVILAAAATATVVNAVAAYGTAGYTATLAAAGRPGFLRYAYGTRSYNGILTHGRPYAGTLRQALSGTSNFSVLATRLMDDVAYTSDLLRIPDFCVIYLKFGVLMKMLSKEGEGQDLPRAKYCAMRYIQGVRLLKRLMSSRQDDITEQIQAVSQ